MLPLPAPLIGSCQTGIACVPISSCSHSTPSSANQIVISPSAGPARTVGNLVDSFAEVLIAEGYAPTTVRCYTRYAAAFIACLSVPERVESLEVDVIRQTLLRLCAAGQLRASDSVAAQAIAAFYKQVFGRCLQLATDRAGHGSTLFSAQDVRRFFAAISDAKHRAAMLFIYTLEANLAEAVGIYLSDVTTSDVIVAVHIRLGGAQRRLAIGQELGQLLQQYVRRYHPVRFLFEGREGGPYSERRLQQILSAASVRAGLRKSAGQKALRIAFQQHLARQGTHLLLLEEALRR